MAKTYRLRWTETSRHTLDISEEELARIKGMTVEELREVHPDDIADGLDDGVAELEDDGLLWDERIIDEVTPL